MAHQDEAVQVDSDPGRSKHRAPAHTGAQTTPNKGHTGPQRRAPSASAALASPAPITPIARTAVPGLAMPLTSDPERPKAARNGTDRAARRACSAHDGLAVRSGQPRLGKDQRLAAMAMSGVQPGARRSGGARRAVHDAASARLELWRSQVLMERGLFAFIVRTGPSQRDLKPAANRRDGRGRGRWKRPATALHAAWSLAPCADCAFGAESTCPEQTRGGL